MLWGLHFEKRHLAIPEGTGDPFHTSSLMPHVGRTGEWTEKGQGPAEPPNACDDP